MTYELVKYPGHPAGSTVKANPDNLRAEILQYPFDPGSGGLEHGSVAYDRGWIGDLTTTRYVPTDTLGRPIPPDTGLLDGNILGEGSHSAGFLSGNVYNRDVGPIVLAWEHTYPAIHEAVYHLIAWLGASWMATQIMINKLGPRTTLRQHRDGYETVNPERGRAHRFHLPVVTNDDVWWWDEITKQSVNFKPGYWHGPVPYAGVLHSMRNDSETDRYHLIVDMEPPK